MVSFLLVLFCLWLLFGFLAYLIIVITKVDTLGTSNYAPQKGDSLVTTYGMFACVIVFYTFIKALRKQWRR